MKKLLYVDVPFQGLKGGDKNRSNFIWNALRTQYDADLLLIKTPEFVNLAIPEHDGYDQLHSIGTTEALPHQPVAIYNFSLEQKRKFRELVDRRRYEIIVFRFLSGFQLAKIAEKSLPDCRIVIDVDMLFSRISELSWSQNKTIQNRYHFVEMMKLKAFEALAFRKYFDFFFTNDFEHDLAVRRYKLKMENARIFPNMMPEQSVEPLPQINPEHPYILFFGTLNSVANQDAFSYLATDIYPRISKKMQDKDIYLYIVGKNPTSVYKQYGGGRIKVIGAVEDINSVIANSLFVVLPLRIASGTRTRILEAAALQKAVISTSIGVEGFAFNTSEVAIYDKAESFAQGIIDLIQFPAKAIELGEKLHAKAMKLYTPEVVKNDFLAALEDDPLPVDIVQKGKKLKLAIITNRFYPEVGGAETNIYYQARMLAKNYDVSVICPKRIKKPKIEETEGFRIIRMFDVYNFPAKYPNLKAKTLCPELLLHLLAKDYDIIQCFPALNYNNYLAFLAAKLKGTPIIMCFFDFIDYAGLIQTEGKIDPDILRNLRINQLNRLVLKGLDYIFAIAEKEIDFIRRYNPKVEYSPVPILSEEYEKKVPNPRANLGIQDDEFIFLALGRVSYIKGQDIALKAFAKASIHLPKAKMIFVGRTDYEQEFFETMQAFISQNSLQDKVFFTGVLDRELVLGWLRFADIHVIPVRFMNSGAVVVESWISDTPVIQSKVVDPNLVVEGYNGYLFPTEDIDICAEKMILAYQNRSKLPQMAERGKILVKSKYTYEYLIGLYANAYKKVRNS